MAEPCAHADIDLFVAYAAEDAAWVDGYLLPQLGLSADRVATQRDFAPGSRVADEFARAVDRSRQTLLILSPTGPPAMGYPRVTGHFRLKPPSPPRPSEEDEMPEPLAYDAFVSYRQQEPDKTWVRKTLVPRLEEAGVRLCVDYRDFRLGAPFVTEMERAVEQSRYTVAVLTPAYFTSGFTEFENVLADHLALEEREQRLLMIRREPIEAPARLRARLWLDMCTEDEVEEALPRLIAALRQPADG